MKSDLKSADIDLSSKTFMQVSKEHNYVIYFIISYVSPADISQISLRVEYK